MTANFLNPDDTALATMAVLFERVAQDEKWGEQNHPLWLWTIINAEEQGEVAHEILMGNQVEALGETIQVAAVAMAAIEADKRNRIDPTTPTPIELLLLNLIARVGDLSKAILHSRYGGPKAESLHVEALRVTRAAMCILDELE